MKKIGFIIISYLFLLVFFIVFIENLFNRFYYHLLYLLFRSGSDISLALTYPSESKIKKALFFFSQEGYGDTTKEYFLKDIYLKDSLFYCFLILFTVFMLVIVIVLLIEKKNQEKVRIELFDQLLNLGTQSKYKQNQNVIDYVNELRLNHKNEVKKIHLDYLSQKENQENIVHQIKASLSIILLNADLMNSVKNENYLEIEEIITQIESCNNMLNDFLKYSTSTSNEKGYKFEYYSIQNCIENGLKRLEKYANNKSIKIKANLIDFYIYMDVFWLTLAIETLLQNSITYAKQGTTIFIKNTFDEVKSEIKIEIKNTINKKVNITMSIFDRYTSTTSQQGHYGIGLHMAKTIIKNHYGDIEIELNENIFNLVVKIPVLPLEKYIVIQA